MSQTASWGRRIVALLVDWLACWCVVLTLIQTDLVPSALSQWYTLGVFVLETAMLTAMLGGSFGQLLTRLRVVRADGRGNVDLLRALFRQVLVALVVPPLVFQPDGRGLHDMAAGSVTVRLEDLLAKHS